MQSFFFFFYQPNFSPKKYDFLLLILAFFTKKSAAFELRLSPFCTAAEKCVILPRMFNAVRSKQRLIRGDNQHFFL